MSTSRTATRKCDLQDVTECPICCLRFERPLQLSCGHSFCGNCVDRLIADARGPGNRNDNYLEAVRGLAANIDQGVNPPHFNRMDQDLWWPLNLNRQQMMPPPPPGLGGIPHPPRYILRNFNDEPPFFPRRPLGANGAAEIIIKCPECRQPTRVPPEGLPINYRLQELLSHVTEVSNQQSNDQCSADGSPLRKCLACDDVISKGVYLLCRTCPGETVRQLCSMCCLRNHNGHDIEEKRFVTMQDVTIARDVVSEATGLGFHYVDLAYNEIASLTETIRELIHTKVQCLLEEFETIANGLQLEILSSNDELDKKVATARALSEKLEMLPRLMKGICEDFHNKATLRVESFVHATQTFIREGIFEDELNSRTDSNSSDLNDGSCSGASTPLRPHRPDIGEERRSIAKKCAMLERRVRQHRLAQCNAQRKRLSNTRTQERKTQEVYVRDQRAYETDRERRDRLREERRNGFLAGDDHNEGHRLQRFWLHSNPSGMSSHSAPRSTQAEDVKRSQSVEIVAETPAAVVDLEQRAERLIISPQRRRARDRDSSSAEQVPRAPDVEQCKHRRGLEADCSANLAVVFNSDGTFPPMHSSQSCRSKKRKFGVTGMQAGHCQSSECPEPGPSSSYVTFPDLDHNSSATSGTSNNCGCSQGAMSDGEMVNVETLDETFLE